MRPQARRHHPRIMRATWDASPPGPGDHNALAWTHEKATVILGRQLVLGWCYQARRRLLRHDSREVAGDGDLPCPEVSAGASSRSRRHRRRHPPHTLAAVAITAVGTTLGHADAPAGAEGYRQLLDFTRAQVPGREGPGRRRDQQPRRRTHRVLQPTRRTGRRSLPPQASTTARRSQQRRLRCRSSRLEILGNDRLIEPRSRR